MQLDEAIKRTRLEAERERAFARTVGAHPFLDRTSIAHEAEIKAEALETVCGALEAFLKRHEEDCSYHSK